MDGHRDEDDDGERERERDAAVGGSSLRSKALLSYLPLGGEGRRRART